MIIFASMIQGVNICEEVIKTAFQNGPIKLENSKIQCMEVVENHLPSKNDENNRE